MARRRDFVSSFLSAVEKEARRAEREQARQYKLEQKRREKIATINQNRKQAHTATEKAISVVAELPCVTYSSLAIADYAGLPDNLNLIDKAVDYLKIGKRIEAIKEYQKSTDLEYNDIIETIKYIEANLDEIIRKNKKYWFKDIYGQYEFSKLNELIKHKQNYDSDGIEIELSCEPLCIHEILTGRTPAVIQNKANTAVKKIATKWLKEFSLYHAKRENTILQEIFLQLNDFLIKNLQDKEETFSWESLKDNSPFVSKHPQMQEPEKLYLKDPKLIEDKIKYYKKEILDKESFQKNILEKVFDIVGLKKQATNMYEHRFSENLKSWQLAQDEKIKNAEKVLDDINNYNSKRQEEYNNKLEAYQKYLVEVVEKEKNEFIALQQDYNNKIDEIIVAYNNKDAETVAGFYEYVLAQTVYPVLHEKNYGVKFNAINNILEVDYILPNLKDVCNIKNVVHVGTKDDFKLNYLTDKQHRELFDKVLYQICFQILNDIFQADKVEYLNTVVFNGYISDIDKKDGQLKTVCVMSLQINKEEFNSINLLNINPKECFKALKGIAAVELASVTPVRPILALNKEDKRFIESYEVMENIEEGYNLATMDWQDFENLVREIFEQEFSQNGGEVKVTQSSRDGGVDAIAFDPDPIRGGKIVIQAKRYTNVVGVSAVRDLYGTVMNEGAIKGIIVTTSDYGSDSYEFAKDKPLTLLNGGHLLHLLEKHGHKARINLQEAKIINKEASEQGV